MLKLILISSRIKLIYRNTEHKNKYCQGTGSHDCVDYRIPPTYCDVITAMTTFISSHYRIYYLAPLSNNITMYHISSPSKYSYYLHPKMKINKGSYLPNNSSAMCRRGCKCFRKTLIHLRRYDILYIRSGINM